MTYSRKRNVRRERMTSLALALLVLAGLWFLAATLQMSGARQRQSQVLRELALERIVLPEILVNLERPQVDEQVSAATAAQKRIEVSRINPSVLENALTEARLPEMAQLERRVNSAHHDVELLEGIERVVPNDLSGRPKFSDDLDLGTASGQRLPGRTSAQGRDDARAPLAGRVPDGPVLKKQERRSDLIDNGFTRPAQRREAPPELPVIKRVERVPSIKEETLDPDELIRWMQLQPRALPSGIKRHVDWRVDNLTSTTVIEHEGETYELYLMARLPIREIHIVLVRESESYYLIDRSFQHEGRKFRVGTARRTRDTITGVVSEERAAGSPEAATFYNVFLSWWQRERLTF